MISRGRLEAPPAREIKYVYVKMLRNQADTQEGKVSKGDVLILDEEKASRWCFRSRVARPATEAEYQRYIERKAREEHRLNPGNRRRRMSIPDENPFTY